ncbi:uncharacterized protein LOC120202789 [Hibiscus syriacus]|uniref:uncharacterized protein LOC120202789 n=1 Tax=Hibiscus syriacus TaxID=106335 RepID=UPI001924336A|nr:uncharacterized protein LOC120202789 [Hibiscus syriacus]
MAAAATAPDSGLMVLGGREAAEKEEVKGIINNGLFKKLPLPSNAMLFQLDFDAVRRYFFFIPVLGQPLSSNRYYIIHGNGKYKGARLTGTNMIVGKWYKPFVFVKDCSLKVQMEKSLFYNVSLERLWEKIYSWENDGGGRKGDVVALSVEIKRGGFVQIGLGGIGLSSVVFEGMRWWEESVVWVDGVEKVEKVVEIGGGKGGGWRRFDCYVLVERFDLRRLDGTLVLNCDFRHTHEIRIKWE